VTQFRQAGFDTSTRYISAATLQYSDNASSWTTAGMLNNGVSMPYHGNNAFGPFYDVVP
jgi:hypothetical protein